MKFILSLSLLLTMASTSVLSAPFHFDKDSLCFKNADSELARFGPLGRLGDKEGVCQGMSGIVSAFYEHAKFSPSKRKLSSAEAHRAMNGLLRYHAGGCNKSKKVEFSGYANLNEFCKDHKDLLMQKAINYNADIAVREIGWNLHSFLYYNDSELTSKFERMVLLSHLEDLRQHLTAGRWPLMLYFRHVVTVHEMKYFKKDGKITKIVFGIYDSNKSKSIHYEVLFSAKDGLPKAGQKMVWDITPDRLTTVCW